MTTKATENLNKERLGTERTFETGKDESWFANIKRTYDRTEENLQGCFNESQRAIVNANNHIEELRAVRLQTLSNMTENANASAKQMIRHGDIAIDRQWNIDEQGHIVEQILSDQKFQDAMGTLLAEAVASAVQATE